MVNTERFLADVNVAKIKLICCTDVPDANSAARSFNRYIRLTARNNDAGIAIVLASRHSYRCVGGDCRHERQ